MEGDGNFECWMLDFGFWMGQSDSFGHFLRSVRLEGHAACRRMEWRLEAAMVGKDGFRAVVMLLESRMCDSWLPGGSHSIAHHRSGGLKPPWLAKTAFLPSPCRPAHSTLLQKGLRKSFSVKVIKASC